MKNTEKSMEKLVALCKGRRFVYPGEREMLALARGGVRVLRGEEKMKTLSFLPDGCESLEELKTAFMARRPDLLDKPAVQAILALS